MAVDKLVDSTQLDTDLTAVANAIRTKGGTSAQLAFPGGFVSAVQAIPTGITPTGTKQISISENGTVTEDVTNYASIEITTDVQGGGEWTTNGLADRSEPSGALLINNNKGIINSAFNNGRLITSVHIANVDPIDVGGYSFAGCGNMTTFVAQNVNIWAASAVQGCSELTIIDVKISNILINYGFQQCAKLSTIIMRRFNSVTPLQGLQCFYGTPFASGGAGGTLYVPQALIANYQSATNWSTILGYANNQILPIEGSIYETQYADGTPIE